MKRRYIVLGAMLGWLVAGPATAEISDGVVRIGLLTDMSGPYAALTGPGSVVAAQLAIEDCLARECKGLKIELLTADHQNKADVALSTARAWIDNQKVDAFADLVNASVQLGMQHLVVERDKVALYPGGTDRLTNEDCAPLNSVQWMWDTYSAVASVTRQMTKPGTSWYFITADYAFGHALERDGKRIIDAGGGKFLGSARHPFPGTTDFSSFLLQAQGSKADVIGIANAGSDVQNAVKQAREFKISGGQQAIATFVMSALDVKGLGLEAVQGTKLAEGFYWDFDDRTRAWSKRFEERFGKGKPSMIHAGVYSSVLHYLKAVAASGSDDAKTAIRAMHKLPIGDDIVRNARLREDGRMVHDYYLFSVKKPAESKEPWDVYTLEKIIPGDQAFRPLAESACPVERRLK